jgi:hypothetical protein
MYAELETFIAEIRSSRKFADMPVEIDSLERIFRAQSDACEHDGAAVDLVDDLREIAHYPGATLKQRYRGMWRCLGRHANISPGHLR